MLNSRNTPRRSLILAAALAAACAAPALAQTVNEVIVTGRYGVGDNVRSLSAPVSYRDLDLTTEAGRGVLRERVRATANDLCRRLGEAGMGGTAAAPSCERDAIQSAQAQEETAFAAATPPAYAAAPPAYAAAPPLPEAYAAPAAPSYGAQAAATVTTQTVTNGPVPDTRANRARYGGPISNGGRRTAPAGN